MLIITTIIGVIGMAITLVGAYSFGRERFQKWCFFVGACFLLASSLLIKDKIFISLEIVIVAGAAMALTSFTSRLKAVIPPVLSFGAFAWMLINGALADWANYIGIAGFGVLAAGYAVSRPLIYLVGSILIAAYSGIALWRGVLASAIWLILNIIFAVGAWRGAESKKIIID